jgi:hypothetical protein
MSIEVRESAQYYPIEVSTASLYHSRVRKLLVTTIFLKRHGADLRRDRSVQAFLLYQALLFPSHLLMMANLPRSFLPGRNQPVPLCSVMFLATGFRTVFRRTNSGLFRSVPVCSGAFQCVPTPGRTIVHKIRM